MTEHFDEEAALAERQQKAQNLAERQESDMKFVLETVQGRRVIWDLLCRAGVFASSFTGDNNATNFNEGRRSEGLRLFNSVMAACPDLYLKMAAEAKEDNEK